MNDSLSLLLKDMRAEVNRRRPLRHLTSLYHKLKARDRLRGVERVGFKLKLTYEGLEKRIIREGFHEPEQLECLFPQVQARGCDIFLDIGANVGVYSMFAAKMGLFAEIHAWEPSPRVFERLQRHLRENNLTEKVHIYQMALSDSCGKVRLSDEDVKKPGGMQIIDSQESGVEVDCATLDSLFDFRGRRLAVKMDVEGHELPALRGAERLFAENEVFLQVEVWSVDTVNYLFSQGFRMIHYIRDDFYFVRDSGVKDCKKL